MSKNRLLIQTASVKVMRSHDYCHFEVALSADADVTQTIETKAVDELRKTAARLADKAVEQYKTAKANFENLERDRREWEWESKRLSSIEKKPEHERTPDEAAALKAHGDHVFKTRYDYEDDWRDED